MDYYCLNGNRRSTACYMSLSVYTVWRSNKRAKEQGVMGRDRDFTPGRVGLGLPTGSYQTHGNKNRVVIQRQVLSSNVWIRELTKETSSQPVQRKPPPRRLFISWRVYYSVVPNDHGNRARQWKVEEGNRGVPRGRNGYPVRYLTESSWVTRTLPT